MKIDHLGYVTKDIEKSLADFLKLGFSIVSELVTDESRKIEIVFIRNESVVIELVSPLNAESDIYELAKRSNNTIYHICYTTSDLEGKIEELRKDKYFLVVPPAEAIAFDNRRVAFMMSSTVGLIELVEEVS